MDGSYPDRLLADGSSLMTLAAGIVKHDDIAGFTYGALTISGFELAASAHEN